MHAYRKIVGLVALLAVLIFFPALGWAQDAAEVTPPDDFAVANESFLMIMFRGLGIRYTWYFAVLYLLQFVAWVAAIVTLVRAGSRPTSSVIATIKKGDPREGWLAVQSDGSYVAGLMKQVLAAVPQASGGQASRVLARLHEVACLRRRTPIDALAWIGIGAFCLGLYGMVDGLIGSFLVLRQSSAIKSSELAEVVGFASFTAYLGLGIACSTTFWYGLLSWIFRRRMAAAALAAEEILVALRPERITAS